MSARRILGAAIVGAIVLGGAACGDDDETVQVRQVSELDADFLPARLGGLTLAEEDTGTDISERTNAYVEGVALYSLREDELLQATLQVSRFHEDADYRSEAFRRAIVESPAVSSSAPRPFRMGDQTVWLTTAKSQRVAIWFEDDLFFLLAVRDDYERFRSLLRDTVEVDT